MEALLGLELGATRQGASNSFSLEGLTLNRKLDGVVEIGIRRLDAASVRISSGPFVLDVGGLVLRQVVGQLRTVDGKPRPDSLEAAHAELSGVNVSGPLIFPSDLEGNTSGSNIHASTPTSDDAGAGPAAGAWCLEPLAAAQGTIRAEIVDAHLLFDADVTVPIRHGQIDFNETTVEHVGPNSSMGVSRLGLYVDAPNGRSYVYQFSSAPVTGVAFERRGALPGPGGMDRGNLRLQSFVEGLLRQGAGDAGAGFTDQARRLLGRTALSGGVQLGDGRFAAPGVEADFAGSADGRNEIRLGSEAVGRGISVEMAALCVRHAVLSASGMQLACDEIIGPLVLRVVVKDAQLDFAFNVPNMKISGLRLNTRRPKTV